MIFLPLLFAVAAADLPLGWKACSNTEKDYDACFTREVQKAIGTLVNGDKKLGVLPLDPLRVSELVIPQRDGPVSLNLKFTDIDLIGLKDLQLKSTKNDWDTGVVASGHVPNLQVIGDYKIDGKILLVPITGQGPCNLTLDGLDLDIKVKWSDADIKGRKYKHMEKLDLVLKPKRLHIKLDNLFNGDKALGDNMNLFMNENWDKILEELSPSITSGLSQALTQVSNRILSKVPAKEIVLK